MNPVPMSGADPNLFFQFAGSEGKRGDEFCTPRSVVRTMVEMLEPYKRPHL